MLINGKEYRSLWLVNYDLHIIDQTKLPFEFSILVAHTYKETIEAIKKMVVRGAPAIGAAGAYAYIQAVNEYSGDTEKIMSARDEIRNARPTAVDLSNVLDLMSAGNQDIKSLKINAEEIVTKIINACEKIGNVGNSIIKTGNTILTHCHTGALAAIDNGTALEVIKNAHKNAKQISVYVDETRPRLQGSLTSWELLQYNIPHKIITDSSAGFLMKQGKIDLVIVGADRICKNGDFANKIGTYSLSVLAKAHNIPFYVAAPITSFDFNLENGESIKIEERDQNEILTMRGMRVHPKESQALNLAFDVTPHENVTGYITEQGIIKSPKELLE